MRVCGRQVSEHPGQARTAPLPTACAGVPQGVQNIQKFNRNLLGCDRLPVCLTIGICAALFQRPYRRISLFSVLCVVPDNMSRYTRTVYVVAVGSEIRHVAASSLKISSGNVHFGKWNAKSFPLLNEWLGLLCLYLTCKYFPLAR